jgi:predicted MFS family arabinose efflux permease
MLTSNVIKIYTFVFPAMKRLFHIYLDAYKGLSRPIWVLAFIMLINRSGTMVVPFLSIYSREAMGFTLQQTGVVLSFFGLGSIGGAWLGGWLTDRFGHFYVQLFSLLIGGAWFIILSCFDQFIAFASGIFAFSVIADSFRPANATAFSSYASPESISRAFSLNRMAFNLGFSIGPAVGGLLAAISFRLLFIADGITCIIAGLFFLFYFRNQTEIPSNPEPVDDQPDGAPRSPYRDIRFILFSVFTCLFGIVFFQLLSTLPLFYREVYLLSEKSIGLLLALNGLVVFSFEMILVYLLGRHQPIWRLIIAGTLLTGLSYVMLNLPAHPAILYASMFVISIAEILAMPFMATWVVHCSDKRNRGSYLGMFTMAYSISLTVGPYLGTFMIDQAGFSALWWSMGGLSVLTAIGFYFVVKPWPSVDADTSPS